MKKDLAFKDAESVFKRSYYGSLILLFFVFILFILRTSFCTQSVIHFDNDEIISRISTENTNGISEIINSEPAKYIPEESKIHSQKNIIKELTVNKILVNINTASVEELTGLKGIGKITAEKIAEYRKENGNFETIEEIMKVKGIGNKKFEVIRDNIILK
jgi:comEA protein